MARNVIERVYKRLMQLSAKMSKGIQTTGTSVPITMLTKPQLDAASAAYNAAEIDFGKKRMALKEAYRNFTPAAAAVYDFLNAARPIFVSSFGYKWSADWAAVGWTNHSTRIPAVFEDRVVLVASIVSFLTDNPSYEVSKTGVTAANGTVIHDNAVEFAGDVATAEMNLKKSDQVRVPAQTALMGLMQLVIKNLGKLSKDDPRWLMFGLNMPGSKTTPDQPTGLSAQMDLTTGGVILSCDAQPLGDRFRFRGREASSGMPFQLLASATAPTGRTKPIAPGTAMEFMVQAVNGGAQSVPSASLFYTVPAENSTEVAVKLPALKPAAVSPYANGNGHSNGHGKVALSRSR